MVTIRPENPDDFASVYNLNKIAFKQDTEAKLVERIRTSSAYIPELSLVAIKDNKVVGHILFSMVSIKTDTERVSVLSLAPMAVLPEFQKQGIGSLLVRKGLRKCKELGFKAVIVVGHPDYYPRFGFVQAQGLKLPFGATKEAFMILKLVPLALEGISGLVEYPPAFDEVL